ncbi:MAG TPA: hypothetical protein VH395_03400 [Jatrophihabitantaceae bacterium]
MTRGLLALTAVVALFATACGGHSAPAAPTSATSATSAQDDRYGPLPTFLPTSTLRPDSVLTGTARRPAVTSQGDSVRVVTGGGSVLATVAGPQLARSGTPAETVTCTWTVTLAQARGRVPIDVADFAAIDEAGRLTQPHLAAGSPAPPDSIAAAQRVRFELSARMPVGEGVVRWAPGGQVVASWDFVAETD